jgi:uncharacterized membrane protein
LKMKRKRLVLSIALTLVLLVLIVFILMWPAEEREVRYTVRTLAVPGCVSNSASSINDLGTVVGHANPLTGKGSNVVWDRDGKAKVIALNVEGNCQFRQINGRGQVFGWVCKPNLVDCNFVWSETDGMRKLDSGKDGYAVAVDMNDLGQASGHWTSPEDETHAVVWNASGEMEDLGLDPRSFASVINNRGTVFGFSQKRLFIHRPNEITTFHGLSHFCSIEDMNDREQVVGEAPNWSQNVADNYRAFLWSATDDLVHLEDWPGYITRALAINNSGQIVGQAEPFENSGPPDFLRNMIEVFRDVTYQDPVYWKYWQGSHAILWEDGELTDLNDLIPGDTDWISLCVATDINERGQIVGYGNHRDTRRGLRTGFVLTPVAEREGP